MKERGRSSFLAKPPLGAYLPAPSTGEPWATESPSSARPAMSGAKCCRSWPSGTSRPMTSWRWPRRARSGKQTSFGDKTVLKVQDLAKFDFKGIDIVLCSPGAKVSAEHSPRAAKAGAVVIDNTSLLAHGSRRAAGRARGQRPGDRRLQGPRHHRQPELLDHPDGGGAEADPRRRRHQARRRVDLSVDVGRRQGRRWTSSSTRPRASS